MKDEICNVLDEANFFEQQGYEKTSSQIVSLAKSVDNKQTTSIKGILDAVIKIGETFKMEFENAYPAGKDYRRKCYSQTQVIVFAGLMAVDKEQLPPPEYLVDLLKKMNQRDEYVNSLSKSLAELLQKDDRSSEESNNMFRDACTIYEQAIEGIFSSAAKILYFLMAKMGISLPETTASDGVWDIWHNFEKSHLEIPIFLENWPEKNSIRNAIAHSQNQYDPILDSVHFVSRDKVGKITYESPDAMTFSDFFAMWMQIADAIDSLRYSMRLYGIFQSLAIASFP
ncbi:MAG: hypothetical protein ABSF44_09485 [Candidatus Bathyarchaeia archaeon]|jgi:hypothetical protein